MIVAVVGKGRNCDPLVEELAEEVGLAIAQAGHTVVCGGLGGVMEGAARGARAAGGQVIGLLPGQLDANEHCALVLRTGVPVAIRNVILASCCDAMLALDGSHGTMQELAVALNREGLPVAQVETHRWTPLGLHMLQRQEVAAWLSSCC